MRMIVNYIVIMRMIITIIDSNDDEIFFYSFLSHQSPISFRSIQDSPPVDACDG